MSQHELVVPPSAPDDPKNGGGAAKQGQRGRLRDDVGQDDAAATAGGVTRGDVLDEPRVPVRVCENRVVGQSLRGGGTIVERAPLGAIESDNGVRGEVGRWGGEQVDVEQRPGTSGGKAVQ